jgi:hypothetical protein
VSNENRSITDLNEPLMTIDKFYKSIVLSGTDAAVIQIIRLILLEPGTIQTHPECGVGIVSKFRHSTEVDIKELEDRIATQISTYLPMYTTIRVAVEIDNKNKSLKIFITSDQLNAIIPISTETGEVLSLDSVKN